MTWLKMLKISTRTWKRTVVPTGTVFMNDRSVQIVFIECVVMAGLVPAIHVFACGAAIKTWMPGTIGERSDAVL